MRTRISTEIEIDLGDIKTEDLLEELLSREELFYDPDRIMPLVNRIWEYRRTGKNYDAELDQLIFMVIGKVA